MRLKKMARCPPSTEGRNGAVSTGGRGVTGQKDGARARGELTDEDGLADSISQGAGAQQQLEGGADATRPSRQPPRQVLQTLRHGRAAPRAPPGRTPEASAAAFRRAPEVVPGGGRGKVPSWVAVAAIGGARGDAALWG